MNFDEAQQAMSEAVARQRRRMVVRTVQTEEELRRIRADVVRRVRADPRWQGRPPSEFDPRMTAAVSEHLERTLVRREREIVRTMTESTRWATQAERDAASRVFGERAESLITMPEGGAAEAFARSLARTEQYSIGGIRLSQRLHAVDAATVAGMQAELADTLRAGRTTIEATERLLMRDRLRVEVPRYVTDLRDAVRRGAVPEEMRRLVRRHASSVERLTDNPNGIRQSSRSFVRGVETMTREQMERQLDIWVMDKARYMEARIVRTESSRAFNAAYVEQNKANPWNKGFKWNLSGQHPKADVCDQLADQNLFELGPGGYPEEEIPEMPAHPHCLCFISSIVDENYFERELARETGEPPPPETWRQGPAESPVEWMQRQTPERRREILGPGRAAVFERDPGQVMRPDGTYQPLWRAQGRRSPPLRRAIELTDFHGSAGAERIADRLAQAAPDPTPPPRPQPPPPRPQPQPPEPRPQPRPRPQRQARPQRPPLATRPAAQPSPPPAPAAPTRQLPTSIDGRALTPEARARLAEVARPFANAQEFGRELVAAKGDPGRTRTAIRRWIQTVHPELYSRDLAQMLPESDRFEVEKAYCDGAYALHNWEGRVVMAERSTLRAFQEASRAIAQASPGDYIAPERMPAMRAMIHEEIHGHNPIRHTAYRGIGVSVEEATTELTARDIAGAISPDPRRPRIRAHATGDYTEWINPLTRTIAEFSGADIETAYQSAITASVRYRSVARSAPIYDGEQAFEDFVTHAHADVPVARRAEFRRVLRERWDDVMYSVSE